MRVKYLLLILLHILLWAFVAVGIYAYATMPHEVSYLKILGSTEKDLSLPVFAQFIVTQTFVVDRPVRVVELAIPLYLPSQPLPLKISLYQDKKLITWWRYPLTLSTISEGYATAHLRFITPTIVRGTYEIRFDGSSIDYQHQQYAPRLFTETFDGAYPYGNYRIAQNKKNGDIVMQIIEQKTTYELFVQEDETNILGKGSQILLWVCGILLLAFLPSMIVDPLFIHS